MHGSDLASGIPFEGYEIHLGETTGPDTDRAFLEIDGRPVGAMSASGRVLGTYVHGLFSIDNFRREFLSRLGAATTTDTHYEDTVESILDELASHLETHLDISRIEAIAHSRRD